MPPNRTRRKLAIATWSAPREGNIYGKLTVDATKLLAFVQRQREELGHKITVTHVVGMALARALEAAPSLNGHINPFGKFIEHKDVDITFLVALEDGADLAKATVRKAQTRSISDLATELKQRAARLREGKDDDFNKSKGPIRLLPMFLLRRIVWLTGFLASSVGISIPAMGVEKFAFGSAIITSVGMFGLDEGFAPPTPFARVPIYVLVGGVSKRPAVVDGELAVRDQLTITATIDHRFLNGSDAGRLTKAMRHLLENPEEIDEDLGNA